MTKEDVTKETVYYGENKISYKQPLSELGINLWSFYDSKRQYAPKQESE